MGMILKNLNIQKDHCELNNVLVLVISLVSSSSRKLHVSIIIAWGRGNILIIFEFYISVMDKFFKTEYLDIPSSIGKILVVRRELVVLTLSTHIVSPSNYLSDEC